MVCKNLLNALIELRQTEIIRARSVERRTVGMQRIMVFVSISEITVTLLSTLSAQSLKMEQRDIQEHIVTIQKHTLVVTDMQKQLTSLILTLMQKR